MKEYIRWFSDIGMSDVAGVGGKNASLGELFRELAAEGIRVPAGFAITAEAYWYFLCEAKLDGVIADARAGIDTPNVDDLRTRGAHIRRAILGAEPPESGREENDRASDRQVPRTRSQDWALWPGAERLPGVRTVPGGTEH